MPPAVTTSEWPELPVDAWKGTYETLHRMTQVIGKVRLALAPMENHWWNVPLYLTSRGLTTSPIPYPSALESFQIDFDFLDHELHFSNSSNQRKVMALEARPVAEFHRDVMATLREMGVAVSIWDVPVEIPEDRTPFHEDRMHASYDPTYVEACWRILMKSDLVFKEFRSRFKGKCSPVHFFWGAFDLAVTRFSGRAAPPRAGADWVTQEAYCEEVSSAGFWPGNEKTGGPVFYSYAAPEPEGFRAASVRPEAAFYDETLGEFLLPYDAVRTSANGKEMLLTFLQSTYEACAGLGRWDRSNLERPFFGPGMEAGAGAREEAQP